MAALALVDAILWLPILSFLFFLSCLEYIGHGYGSHALVLEFFRCIPPFPFTLICLVLVWVCLLRVLSLLCPGLDPFLPFPMLLCLWSDLLFLVPGVFLLPPFSGVLGKSFFSFSHPLRFFSQVLFSFWLGGEV